MTYKTYELTFIHASERDPQEHDSYRLEVQAENPPKTLSAFDGGTARASGGYQATYDDHVIQADEVREDTIHLLLEGKPVWDVSQHPADLSIGAQVTVGLSDRDFSSVKAKITWRSW